MRPYQEVERFIQYAPADLREIAFELRNLVAEVAPTADEDIRPGGINYYFKQKGGHVSAGICGITIKSDHVRLFFPHGAFIHDPQKLLRGSGKAMRYVPLMHYDLVPWNDVRALIEEHASFDPSSMAIF